MSESLLRSLMQLFAIMAKLESQNSTQRDSVESFLIESLGMDEHENWLMLYDEYLEANRARLATQEDSKRNRLTVRDSSRLLLICTRVNEELTQRQKTMVLFILFSFVRQEEGQIPAEENEFLSSVAEIFNISNKEFHQLETFALGRDAEDDDSAENMVLIANQHAYAQPKVKKIVHEEVEEGMVTVLRMAALGMYLVRYSGQKSMYLNGVAMRQNRIYSLSAGSSLETTNKETPIYYSDIVRKFTEDEVADRITFEVCDLTYRFSNGKLGLQPIDMAEESGRMVGLMGPSGAGKSTLLEVLNGNLKPSTGQVLINGKDLYANKGLFKGVIGYVPQDDLLIEELSVFQNLYFAAKLCFGTYDEAQLTRLVDKTLSSLGLFHIRNLQVGGTMSKTISGGERKRVNIGLELLRAPKILFVDEPTSGLSSRDSVNVMELLKDLAERQGKLVFVVIHQPSSDIFKMFDRLVILDTGGYPIYQGNPVEAIRYFKARTSQINKDQAICHDCGNVNPEQIFDTVETRVVNEFGLYTGKRKYSPQWWNEQYQQYIKLPSPKQRTATIATDYVKAPILRQLITFVQRDVLSKFYNKQYLAINLIEAPALALLLSFVFKYYKTDELTTSIYSFQKNDNIPVFLFISIIVALFLGLTVSAEEIFKDRRILKREVFLHLSKNAYFGSKMLILFSLSAIQALLFVWLGNMVLDIRGMAFEHWAVLFSVSCFANMLGLNISSAFNSAVTIYILIPILLIPQLVLGGIVIKFDQINPMLRSGDKVPIYGEIMASRWAYEALMVHQFRENPFVQPTYQLDRAMSEATFKTVHLLQELVAKLNTIEDKNGTRKIEVIKQIDKNLALVIFNLNREVAITKIRSEVPQGITYANYTPKVHQQMIDCIAALKTHYNQQFATAQRAKDAVFIQMRKGLKSAEEFTALQAAYTNDAVEDMVKNKKSELRIVQEGNQFIQKHEPIYKMPQPQSALDFRTHFFAPVKYLFGIEFSTLWFNVLVIWGMCLALYITLYYNILGKIIKTISRQ